MINLYVGFDEREEIGFHTFCSSVIHHATEPVSIMPLHLQCLSKLYDGGHRDGTNAFIYSRFLIPYIQGFNGTAIFMDGSDMLCKADIAELWAMRNPFVAVQVVPHDYKTKHPQKKRSRTTLSQTCRLDRAHRKPRQLQAPCACQRRRLLAKRLAMIR